MPIIQEPTYQQGLVWHMNLLFSQRLHLEAQLQDRQQIKANINITTRPILCQENNCYHCTVAAEQQAARGACECHWPGSSHECTEQCSKFKHTMDPTPFLTGDSLCALGLIHSAGSMYDDGGAMHLHALSPTQLFARYGSVHQHLNS